MISRLLLNTAHALIVYRAGSHHISVQFRSYCSSHMSAVISSSIAWFCKTERRSGTTRRGGKIQGSVAVVLLRMAWLTGQDYIYTSGNQKPMTPVSEVEDFSSSPKEVHKPRMAFSGRHHESTSRTSTAFCRDCACNAVQSHSCLVGTLPKELERPRILQL